MRQRITAILLVVMLGRLPLACLAQATPASTASGIAAQVRLIPIGAFVEVRFAKAKKARGYLSEVGLDGFSFNTGKAATGTVRQAAFSDVESVRVVLPTHTPVVAWIATGVIAVVGVVVVAVFLIERHNE